MIGRLIALYALWRAWRDRNVPVIEFRVVGSGEWTYIRREDIRPCRVVIDGEPMLVRSR